VGKCREGVVVLFWVAGVKKFAEEWSDIKKPWVKLDLQVHEESQSRVITEAHRNVKQKGTENPYEGLNEGGGFIIVFQAGEGIRRGPKG